MGRPAKNPEHPLTRLRKVLSTPTREITRALFSKRVGIPEATIKAIETGKFKISDKNAAQIASATKVDPKCLIDPSLPLTDYLGVPLEGQTMAFATYFEDEFFDIKALFDTSLQVAEEKQKQAVFSFLFQRWLEETSEILGLGPSITDKLLEGYPDECFAAIPHYFWPKGRKKQEDLAKRVKTFEKELRSEFVKLMPETVRTSEKSVADDQSLRAFISTLVQSILREEFDYAGVAMELRKKKIEEAKASLQKKA
jgi:DNA-binding XRE family transcriptional regulator